MSYHSEMRTESKWREAAGLLEVNGLRVAILWLLSVSGTVPLIFFPW